MADDSHVFGRDVDREKIIKLLLEDGPKISVIPIVGIGGIGKTTLAQFVYNDLEVDKHFDMKAWTFVSDDFNVVRITKSILNSVGFAAYDSEDLIGLQIKVKKVLTGKKFLIVLDDVWSTKNYGDWDVLMSAFRVGAPGSKIIVTTRDQSVGFMMGTVDNYYLDGLSDEDCWKLFVEHAFGNRNIDTNLAVIGKKIVTKCKGLPLAIKTLGGLLRSKPEEHEWEDILNSRIWDENNDSLLSPALILSYDHLPSHLKRRFHKISKKHYKFQAFWKWLVVISNISFEILALAFDQLSSPNKLGYALAGLVMSLVAVVVCLTEFGWKARKEKVTMKRWGLIWWFYYRSPRGRLYGTFAEIFGLSCAILQVISSAIQFGFFHQHADYPIEISIFPVIFALCVSGSKFINNPNEHPRQGHSVVVHRVTELEGIAVRP